MRPSHPMEVALRIIDPDNFVLIGWRYDSGFLQLPIHEIKLATHEIDEFKMMMAKL